MSSSGPSRDVYLFDPGSGRVQTLGRLPHAVGHAAAVALGGHVFVAGGQDASGNVVSALTEVDPSSGSVKALNPLPRAVSDAGAVPLTDGRSALIVGGYRGHALAQVLRLRMTG